MLTEKKIKLNAFNLDDLKIFSFLCQDAIFNRDEFFYDRTKKFFVATLTRYCWEKEESNDQNINFRVVSGLQIKYVELPIDGWIRIINKICNKLNTNIPRKKSIKYFLFMLKKRNIQSVKLTKNLLVRFDNKLPFPNCKEIFSLELWYIV